MKKYYVSILMAILAAVLYAISAPFSKLLLNKMDPTMMAAFLYLGAGAGMGLIGLFRKRTSKGKQPEMTRKEFPYVAAMILLDVAAPIFLLIGLNRTTAGNASLLNNFEIVATSMIAMIFFKETVGKKLWAAIALITLSSILLSLDGEGVFRFSIGSIFVLLACVCWGIENNCTRMLSFGDPLKVVVIKGFGSGTISLVIALILKERTGGLATVLLVLLLGFVAYGLSIFFYVFSQRELGASRTSAYYAVAPFVGAALSFLVLQERPGTLFYVALLLMAIGSYLAAMPDKKKQIIQ